MLIDTSTLMAETLDSLQDLDFDSDLEDQFDLPIESITSNFFKYGEPVPLVNRAYLGEF